MTSPFDRIAASAAAARDQFSVLGKLEDNAEVLKELAGELMGALSALVHSAGGDSDYLEPWIDGVSSDIDLCFRDAVQTHEEAVVMFKPRRGLGLSLAKGASL